MSGESLNKGSVISLCLWGLLLSFPVLAQQEPGSTLVFPLEALYERVLEHHPQVKQAGLLTEEAALQIREARGVFDPKLQSDFDRKLFGKKEYFTTWKSELKIPVLINTDLKVGYEQNSGTYLNPQNYVPEAGLLYAGISLPLGQGLFTDARRTDRRVARLGTELAEAERIKLLNKLLYEAAKDYWDWALAFQQLRISEEGVDLARFRFEGIQQGVLAGDVAPIDSVEAGIVLQSREIDLAQSRLDYQNALLQLSVYLWNEEGEPLMPAESIIPEEITQLQAMPLQPFEELASLTPDIHPELRKLNVKLQQIEASERLYRELLKPLVNVQYNYLNQPSQLLSEVGPQIFSENYKLGINFSFPLLLRKERAKLQINRVKQQRTLLDLSQQQRMVNTVLQQAYNDYLNLQQLFTAQQRVVASYEILLEGELEKFNAGESSLFLVNQRENKLLEARQKLLSQAAKYQKARAAVSWSAGLSVSGELPLMD
jgi:outer membrane protein TolC